MPHLQEPAASDSGPPNESMGGSEMSYAALAHEADGASPARVAVAGGEEQHLHRGTETDMGQHAGDNEQDAPASPNPWQDENQETDATDEDVNVNARAQAHHGSASDGSVDDDSDDNDNGNDEERSSESQFEEECCGCGQWGEIVYEAWCGHFYCETCYRFVLDLPNWTVERPCARCKSRGKARQVPGGQTSSLEASRTLMDLGKGDAIGIQAQRAASASAAANNGSPDQATTTLQTPSVQGPASSNPELHQYGTPSATASLTRTPKALADVPSEALLQFSTRIPPTSLTIDRHWSASEWGRFWNNSPVNLTLVYEALDIDPKVHKDSFVVGKLHEEVKAIALKLPMTHDELIEMAADEESIQHELNFLIVWFGKDVWAKERRRPLDIGREKDEKLIRLHLHQAVFMKAFNMRRNQSAKQRAQTEKDEDTAIAERRQRERDMWKNAEPGKEIEVVDRPTGKSAKTDNGNRKRAASPGLDEARMDGKRKRDGNQREWGSEKEKATRMGEEKENGAKNPRKKGTGAVPAKINTAINHQVQAHNPTQLTATPISITAPVSVAASPTPTPPSASARRRFLIADLLIKILYDIPSPPPTASSTLPPTPNTPSIAANATALDPMDMEPTLLRLLEEEWTSPDRVAHYSSITTTPFSYKTRNEVMRMWIGMRKAMWALEKSIDDEEVVPDERRFLQINAVRMARLGWCLWEGVADGERGAQGGAREKVSAVEVLALTLAEVCKIEGEKGVELVRRGLRELEESAGALSDGDVAVKLL